MLGSVAIGREATATAGQSRSARAARLSAVNARMPAMRWAITLSATEEDAERLLAASIEGLAPQPDETTQVLLELEDSFGDARSDETRQAVREYVEPRVRHINGFGKLRWGRGFEGVAVKAARCFNSTGAETQVVFLGTAYGHLQPRE